MNSRKLYLLFRCPGCGFYSLAPTNQKTRLCVRCGKTIIIDHFHSRVAQNFREAQRMLGELNSKRDGEDPKGVTVLQNGLKPSETGKGFARASTKGILRKFREDVLSKYINREVELADLLTECESHGIEKEYAEKLIGELVETGQAYRPNKNRIVLL